MKINFWILVVVFFTTKGFAQETINGTIQHDDLERSYILYVPENYDGLDEVPLVFNFHGYSSNASQQMNYGDFRALSNEHGFIIVHPQGELLAGLTHWNVGGWTIGSMVDDVGFTESLIDKLSTEYKINPKRIYSTGMSNGGYMSFLLACQASDRFAAVASVTGSMTPEIYNDCNPSHPTPMLQIHGTEDGVVPYEGAFWTKSIDDVMAYWVTENECDMTSTTTEIPDINTADESTIEKIEYSDCANNVRSIHYKVTGGGHTWPGSIFNSPGTNQDLNASEVIWEFFSSYDLDGSISTANVDLEKGIYTANIFPNPATSRFKVEYDKAGIQEFIVRSIDGVVVKKGSVRSGDFIDVSDLQASIYFFISLDSIVKFVKI